MLSNQTLDLTPGRHQRQHSTPTVFDLPKTATTSGRQFELHKRGLSLDQPAQLHQLAGTQQQDETNMSIEHILGQRLTQQNLREAQQQQDMARPGHEDFLNETQVQALLTATHEEPHLESGFEYININIPHSFDEQRDYQDTYNNRFYNMFQGNDSTPSAGNFDGFGNGLDGSIINTPFNETTYTRQTSLQAFTPVQFSQGPPSGETPQRPCTPLKQIATGTLPLTPATTPFSRRNDFNGVYRCRTAESSPTRGDPNMTIKASHAMRRGMSYQDNFAAMRQPPISPESSPPRGAPLKARSSLDLAAFPQPSAFSMSSLKMDIPQGHGGYDAANYSPMSNAVSSTVASFQSSPEMTGMILDESMYPTTSGNPTTSTSPSLPNSQSNKDIAAVSSPIGEYSHQESQSILEIDYLEGIEDTGVTADEVNSFIIRLEGSDNTWRCLYPGCKHQPFGRKENAKSHVQTHLDDRKYSCKGCGKGFVRSHDLKRHARIHTGIKPYQCACLRFFARHDALTRHRQRDTCVGSLSGICKKQTKRGRPKKTRPDTQERLEKAARTRQKVIERKFPGKYSSSASSSSVSAYSSPEQSLDDMDFMASSPPGDETLLGEIHMPASSHVSYTPVASPSYSTGNCFSSQNSQHSGSRKSSGSSSSTPPALDLSSSSPALPPLFSPDAFTTDFDLSPSLPKPKTPGEPNFSNFSEFLNVGLWDGDGEGGEWGEDNGAF